MATGIAEVFAEMIDLSSYIADYEPCRQCPRPSECIIKQLVDRLFCPYLLLYGFNHVIGYVMVKCSAGVSVHIVPCLPMVSELNHKVSSNYNPPLLDYTPDTSAHILATVKTIHTPTAESHNYSELNFFNKSSVIKIQQSDFACPPLWHQMEHMCFMLPHYIHKKTVDLNLPCSCAAVGGNIYSIHGHERDILDRDLKYVDKVLNRYLNVLTKTYRGDLLINNIDKYSFFQKTRLVRVISVFRFGYHAIESLGFRQNGNLYEHEACTSMWCFDQELCSMNISRQEISCPHGFFVCKDHTCVVETSICDGQEDCVDGDDELGCSEICSDPHPTTVCTQCTIAEGCRCNTLYFQCSSGGCVSAAVVCDGAVSCADGSDEALCRTRPQQMSCGITSSFNPYCGITERIHAFKQRCVYSQSDARTSDGSHLVLCMDWQCSSMYKCDAAYCVPIHYVCDRICDCPTCNDEYGCIRDADYVMMSCPGMVKCKLGYPCVHSYYVHDGESQCMDTHDDEFTKPLCPAKCDCLGTAIYCPSFVNISVQDFTAISAINNDITSLHRLEQQWADCAGKCDSFVVLDISNVSNWDNAFMDRLVNLHQIHVLNVSSNLVRVLRYSLFSTFNSIIQLYMRNCSIYDIEYGVFVQTSLHILDLSYNTLTVIADTVFGIMPNLVQVILRKNQIRLINFKVFHVSAKLTSLDLRDNEIIATSLDPALWISTLHLEVLYSDEQVLCCIIPTNKLCCPSADKFQSCSTLLQREYNKYILGSVAIVIIALNGGALVYVIFWKSHQRRANKRQIWSSGFSTLTDTILGVYITGLVASDIAYGLEFGKYREWWKVSTACLLLETSLMYFITSSSFLMLHMCGVLLYSIIDISNKISNKHYKFSLIGSMLGCAILSFLRRLINVKSYILEMNIFCMPFITRVVVKTSNIQLGFEWSWLIVQVIFVTLVVLGVGAVIRVILKQETNLNRNRTNSKNRISKLIVYICMVMTSKVPWLMIWFCVLIGVQISPEVLLRVVISTLSIWPIVHPFMHTIGLGK